MKKRLLAEKMEKLKQEQQLREPQKKTLNQKKGKVTFHNPNSKEVTAGFVGKILLKELIENSISKKEDKESF